MRAGRFHRRLGVIISNQSGAAAAAAAHRHAYRLMSLLLGYKDAALRQNWLYLFPKRVVTTLTTSSVRQSWRPLSVAASTAE